MLMWTRVHTAQMKRYFGPFLHPEKEGEQAQDEGLSCCSKTMMYFQGNEMVMVCSILNGKDRRIRTAFNPSGRTATTYNGIVRFTPRTNPCSITIYLTIDWLLH